jgi:STAS domain
MNVDAGARTALALHLEIGGRRRASARVEVVHEREARIAHVALSGWIDGAAERRLERALEVLEPRAISRVVVDCSRVRRIAGPTAARLMEAMARIESGSGAVEMRGLPRSSFSDRAS